MAKYNEWCAILRHERLQDGIYSMWLASKQISAAAGPGQFLSIYMRDGSHLLPRPISICETDCERGCVRIVYRIAGKGTQEMSHWKEGEQARVLGPLGSGFPVERCKKERTALLVGGGIGIPPLVELAKRLGCKKQIVAGYRDSHMFLKEELEAAGDFYAATEDGSAGTKGNVLDAIQGNGLEADVIYACGPAPMLRALKAYAGERGIECWISMEERMACGVGACLACVCQTAEKDEHSQVHNRRVCKDGPVFLATEIEL